MRDEVGDTGGIGSHDLIGHGKERWTFRPSTMELIALSVIKIVITKALVIKTGNLTTILFLNLIFRG